MIQFYKRLFSILSPKVKKYIIASLLIGIFSFMLESFAIVVLQGFLVSIDIVPPEKALLPNWYPTSLSGAALALTILGIVRSLFIYFKTLTRMYTGNIFLKEQRSRLFAWGMANAHRESTQSLVNNFTETIQKSSTYVSILTQLVIAVVSSGLLLVACFKIAPAETLFGLVGVGILAVPFHLLTKRITELGKLSAVEIEEVSKNLIQSFRNYFFLKVSNTIGSAQETMDHHLTEYEKINNSFAVMTSVKSSFPFLIATIVVALITLFSHQYFATKSILLLSFFYLFTRAGNSISDINANLVSLRFYRTYMEKLFIINQQYKDRYENQVAYALGSASLVGKHFENISFENVSFGFANSNLLYQNLSFNIKAGDIFLIKGESGIGKSTLISLILGVNYPTSGRILLNNTSTDDLIGHMAPIVGYVGPEPFLINGTVKANLIYGLSSASVSSLKNEDYWQALTMAGVDSFVLSFGNKLEEVINEHAQISTGQQQRLSIARAFIKRPQVFIFDEATANLDKNTERKIVEEWIQLAQQGKTIILISHKDSFDHVATQTLYLSREMPPLLKEGVSNSLH